MSVGLSVSLWPQTTGWSAVTTVVAAPAKLHRADSVFYNFYQSACLSISLSVFKPRSWSATNSAAALEKLHCTEFVLSSELLGWLLVVCMSVFTAHVSL